MSKIPKKIHYCWFGKQPLPESVTKCMKTWDKHNPEYDIIKWDETNSPMDHPFVLSAYKSGKFAFVSDYVRLWALYNHGGIYLDTDMWLIKNLDKFLDNECFFGYEDQQKLLISAGIFGNVKKNNFIELLIKEYDNKLFLLDDISSFVIPKIITQVYRKNLNLNVKIYSFEYFYPFPFNKRKQSNFLEFKTNKTHAIHLWNMSWDTKRDVFFRKCKYYIRKIKNIIIEF